MSKVSEIALFVKWQVTPCLMITMSLLQELHILTEDHTLNIFKGM